MSLPSKPRRKVLVGILVLVLIISVGLNMYTHFIVLPQMEATINNMRGQALNAWLGKMWLVESILKGAETNIDVEDAHVHASWARPIVDIFTEGIDIWKHSRELYYKISRVTHYLDEALHRIHFGNQTGSVTERNLDTNVLTMIKNITTNIENLRSITGFMRSTPQEGVEPTQQLREAGVLTDVLHYLEQIYQVSIDVLNYYR